MKDKPKVQPGASHRSVAQLLRETGGSWGSSTAKECRLYEELGAAEKAVEDREKEVLGNDQELGLLRRKAEVAKEAWDAARTKRMTQHKKIHHRFLAEGPTPRVVAALNKLLDEMEEDI